MNCKAYAHSQRTKAHAAPKPTTNSRKQPSLLQNKHAELKPTTDLIKHTTSQLKNSQNSRQDVSVSTEAGKEMDTKELDLSVAKNWTIGQRPQPFRTPISHKKIYSFFPRQITFFKLPNNFFPVKLYILTISIQCL